MGKRRPLEGDSYWLEADPLAALQGFDPLRETTAQARAQRRGEAYVPFEERTPPATPGHGGAGVKPLSESLPPAAPVSLLDILRRANANRSLSPMGLKILLAVMTLDSDAPVSLSQFSEKTGLSKTGVISGIRNALDQGVLTRQQSCPRCEARLPFSEDQKTMRCSQCRRDVPPQARYAVISNDSPVFIKDSPSGLNDSPVIQEDSLPVTHNDRAVVAEDSPVMAKPSLPVFSDDREAVTIKHSPVTTEDRLKGRIAAFTSRMRDAQSNGAVHPVVLEDSPPSLEKDRSRARTDSESVTRIKESDSRIPATPGSAETGRVVYASGEWQQITEKLAKDSAKRIGDKSIGFHVKVWAHARKIDWEKGGRHFEEGLLAIAQELEGKHTTTGKSQGALWTKMVRRYFEEKSCPLLTEAEAEEWKELHGSYVPPTL